MTKNKIEELHLSVSAKINGYYIRNIKDTLLSFTPKMQNHKIEVSEYFQKFH